MQELIEGRDYEVIDENRLQVADDGSLSGSVTDYLERTAGNAVGKLAGLLNQLTSGNKGRIATIALGYTDIPLDHRKLKAAYERHPQAVDAYFEQIDVQKLIELAQVDTSVAKSGVGLTKGAAALTLGVIIGVAGLTIYNQRKSTNA